MMLQPLPAIQVLDVLCPMHLQINATGHITHCGPTLRKLRPSARWEGERLLEVFRILRPRAMQTMAQFEEVLGKRLHLEMRDEPRTSLKGVITRDAERSGYILNTAFGISFLDAVRDYELTGADFAPTDPTVEMLYLVEAKSAAMDASRKLNLKLQSAKQEAEQQAVTDGLTGLMNRRAMDDRLRSLIASATPFALMHVDLDFFKSVNDTLGHAAGDHVLLNVARIFRELTRDNDIVGRVGGDEFVILLPGRAPEAELARVGRRIIDALEIPLDFKGNTCRISGSIGTVIWDGVSPTDADMMLDDADVALYASKHAGRGCQTFYHPDLRAANTAGTAPISAR